MASTGVTWCRRATTFGLKLRAARERSQWQPRSETTDIEPTNVGRSAAPVERVGPMRQAERNGRVEAKGV